MPDPSGRRTSRGVDRPGAAPKGEIPAPAAAEPQTYRRNPVLLPPFQLERYFARYEFTVRHLLCASDCESMTIKDVLALEADAGRSFDDLWLGYTESQGAPMLRQAICGLYETIVADQVLVHSGAEEAIFLFMQAALKPGDHVVVHWPGYQSLHEVARAMGCEVSFWEAREAQGWALDPDELAGLIRPDTRVVVLNTPHNPTGWLMPRNDFLRLNRMLDARSILLFSDEVYRDSEYGGSDRLPAACDISGQAVSLGVMSKTYGLPGLRIGWVATRNREIVARMAALKDYTTICNSAPGERLAEIALRHREGIIRRNLEIIAANLDTLDDFFQKHAGRFRWTRPKAGPIAFVGLNGGAVAAFCHELAHRAGVLLLPGTLFGHGGNYFRIGFGRRNLPAAVAAFDRFLLG
ncbi:MAG TPA: aminotransferase class I/II-fold pyridoxal phosphate-dependent enzyme, partial [Desulfosarcina sp.]|nr:aminotransferase class I/II-fold pyridoxal phosphate-dependent enzyme [Desulfosarcina sp.]